MKKQNKYSQTINAELDLHGLTRDEAKRELTAFLEEARDKKFRYIRIITGKGLHSTDGGVLGPLTKAFLNEQGLRYREAKITDGGTGALIVSL